MTRGTWASFYSELSFLLELLTKGILEVYMRFGHFTTPTHHYAFYPYCSVLIPPSLPHTLAHELNDEFDYASDCVLVL